MGEVGKDGALPGSFNEGRQGEASPGEAGMIPSDGQDILASRQLPEEIRHDILLKILENSYDEIFVIDKDQTILYVNPVCRENYGLSQNEMIGTKAFDLIRNGYCYPAVAPEVLNKKKTVTIEQSTNTGKKLMCTATPVLDASGEIELIVENSRDITQLENIKQDLEEARELLKKFQGEVHELRNNQLRSIGFVAHSVKMQQILETATHVASTDANVLITGETGTGKSLLATYIHKMSYRKQAPFIRINCAAIPDNLFESELFGYEEGAFTGARRQGKIGLIELASGGTLFLDEIGEIPLSLQPKILDFIENQRFMRVGGNREVKVDVRILAATNKNLKEPAENARFRQDLFYRLSVVEINIPPLRERPDDLMPLLYNFLNGFDKKYKKDHTINHDALDILLLYSWPGNVRELRHLVERLVITVPETLIQAAHLPHNIAAPLDAKEYFEHSSLALDEILDNVTERIVSSAYHKLGSSYKVADKLGISQSKASRLIRRHCNRSENRKAP